MMFWENTYFVPGFGLSRHIVISHIHFYLGAENLTRPYNSDARGNPSKRSLSVWPLRTLGHLAYSSPRLAEKSCFLGHFDYGGPSACGRAQNTGRMLLAIVFMITLLATPAEAASDRTPVLDCARITCAATASGMGVANYVLQGGPTPVAVTTT